MGKDVIPNNSMKKKAEEADAMLKAMQEGANEEEKPKVVVEEIFEKEVEPKVVEEGAKEVVEPVEALQTKEVAAPILDIPKVDPVIEKLKADVNFLKGELEKKDHTREVDKGRVKVEVEELKKQISERDAVIKELNDKSSTDDTLALFTEEEQDDLDPRYIEMSDRTVKYALEKAKVITDSRIEALTQTIEDMRETVVKDTRSTYESKVCGELGLSIEQVAAMDKSAEFTAFTEGRDGFSGNTIGQSLDAAINSGDVKRTVNVYKAYLDSRQASAVVPKVTPAIAIDRSSNPAPLQSANTGTDNNNVAPTHAEISTMFAKREISHSEMSKLMKEADKVIESNFSASKV